MSAEKTLRGKTLRIYLYMLKHNRPLGIREIMRALEFSSPSIVHYHINKLVQAGYVEQVGSKYKVAKPIKVGIVKYFTIISGKFLPRFALYAGFFTVLFIFELIIMLQRNDSLIVSILSMIVTFLAVIIFWIESIRFWKEISEYL